MILRPYKTGDAASIIQWCRDEAAYLKWSGGRFGAYPISAETMDAKYRNNNGDCIEADNFYPLTACEDNEIIGHMIVRYTQGAPTQLRFGWVIVDAEKRGKGYGKQMIRLALKYAFELLGAERVTIGSFENNMAAYYCYKAAGFRDAVMGEEVYDEIGGEKWKILEMELTKADYFDMHD